MNNEEISDSEPSPEEDEKAGASENESEGGAAGQEFLAIQICGEEYAVDIHKIKEVLRPKETTYVPRVPDYIKGVICLRGTIVPIFDLAKRLGLRAPPGGGKPRIVALALAAGVVGVMADSVNGVVRLSDRDIEPPPSTLVGAQSDYVRGVGHIGDRFLIIMDVEKTFYALNLFSEAPGLRSKPMMESMDKEKRDEDAV